MKIIQSDPRFVHITDCEIRGLYRKIPKQFGGWKIEISYKDDDSDLFSNHTSINIDQQKFGTEISEHDFESKERLCYTHGMTDIDIFKQGKRYVIYYSVHDGSYVYYFFNEKEFSKLKTWLKLENE